MDLAWDLQVSWLNLLDLRRNKLFLITVALSRSLPKVTFLLLLRIFLDVLHRTSFLLVLGHVPLGDVLLATKLAHKWPEALMLPHVDIIVGTRIIFFVAPFIGAMELINILVCFFMVSQDPMLPEL